jgi:hypothetical protein
MFIKGLALNSTSLPILSTNFSTDRNLLIEESCGSVGEPKIYGGNYTTNGQFSAAYRPEIFNTYIQNGLLGNTSGGVGESFSFYDVSTGDQYGKVWTFASCAITSCELSVRTKDFAHITFDWIGTYKKPLAYTLSAPDNTKEIPIFYNATIQGIKCTGVTIKITRPLGNDDNILGSQYTQSLYQNANLNIEGSISLSNRDYTYIDDIITTGDEANWNNDDPKSNVVSLGQLVINLHNPSGTKRLTTITLPNINAVNTEVSTEGQSRFEKSIKWRATTSNTSAIQFSDVYP